MDIIDEFDEAFVVHTLADALGIGLDLVETFGPLGDFCAVWLGDPDGGSRDFVVLTEDRGRDIDDLVSYASAVSQPLGADRAILWRSADDLTDAPALAIDYFDRREAFENSGVTLIDEIVLSDDELRSVAVTTFTDESGWDDVTDRVFPVR